MAEVITLDNDICMFKYRFIVILTSVYTTHYKISLYNIQ